MSGIYIPGIEIPKDGCMDCPMHKWTFAGEKCCVTAEIVGGNVERGGFPTNCPLVPVPKHGRLIDADALRQTMYHEAFETDSPMQKWDSGCWIRYKMFERMEENAPTIIPADSSVMYYPQVNGITPTVIAEEGET